MTNRPVRMRYSEKNLDIIGIPHDMRENVILDFKTFGNPDLQRVRDAVSDYISNIARNYSAGMGFFFSGSNGVGKTMLASIILRTAYLYRYTAKRVTFVEYIARYTNLWGIKNSDEKQLAEEDFYNYFKAVDFLALEEVGKEIDSKVAIPILEDLLRYREDKQLPTIICSNLSFAAFLEKYGASCSSLVRGNMTPVIIESKDFRKEKK